MTPLRPVVRNSIVLVGGTFLSKALVSISYIVLTRTLGAEDFGRFTYLFVYLAFFELLADSGIEPILVRGASQDAAHSGQRLGDALRLRAALVAIAVVLALALFPWVHGSAEGTALLLIACGNLLVSFRRPSLRSLFELPYRLALRMEIPTLLGVFSEIACLALLVLTIDRYGLASAVVTQVAAPLPFAIALVFLARRRIRPVLERESKRLVALLRATLPLLGALLANVLLVRFDVLALERFRGPAEVGIYTAPVRLVELATLLPTLLMTSLFPMMSAAHAEGSGRIDRLYERSVRFLLGVYAPLAAIQIVCAAPIVRFLFGGDFAASAAVLPLLAVTQIFVNVDIVVATRLIAAHHERRTFHLVLIAAAACVAANLALVPRFGGVGAAWALVVALAARFVAMLAFRDTRPLASTAVRAIFPATLAAALALAGTLAVRRALGETVLATGGGLDTAATAAGVLALYAPLLLLFRGLRSADLAIVREIPAAAGRPGEEPPAGEEERGR